MILHSKGREEFYKAKNFFFVITIFKTISIFEGSLVLTVVYIWLCGDRSHSDVPALCAHEHSALLPQLQQGRPCRWRKKIQWVLPSQRSGSVGFLRNKAIVLEKISWKVIAVSHVPENTLFNPHFACPLLLPLLVFQPGLSWSLLLPHPLDHLLCSLSICETLEWLLLTQGWTSTLWSLLAAE